MRILGIDPGLARVGFGLVEIAPRDMVRGINSGDSEYGASQWGVISTTKDFDIGTRLQEIYDDLTAIMTQLKPDVVSIERLFYFRNNTTLVPVAQARGIILLVVHQFGLPVFEYTPMQVKQAITGFGKSEKKEIQELLVTLLGLKKVPTPDDAADGLALAICHYNHVGRLQHLHGLTTHPKP